MITIWFWLCFNSISSSVAGNSWKNHILIFRPPTEQTKTGLYIKYMFNYLSSVWEQERSYLQEVQRIKLNSVHLLLSSLKVYDKRCVTTLIISILFADQVKMLDDMLTIQALKEMLKYLR